MATYRLPATLAPDDVAFGGRWDEGTQSATAGSGAALELNFTARDVYLVLGGSGTVTVSVNGARPRTVTVAGIRASTPSSPPQRPRAPCSACHSARACPPTTSPSLAGPVQNQWSALSGQMRATTLPTMSERGTTPQYRLSQDSGRLSPITK